MPLFSRKKREPIVHPSVARVVYIHASLDAAIAQVRDYSRISSPKSAPEQPVRVAATGGWVAVRLPDTVHPWQLHNLAFWMLDCPGVDGRMVASAAASTDHPAYSLVLDPEMPDTFCGWDSNGEGWTVEVPSNEIVRPEPVPVAIELDLPEAFEGWTTVDARFEDPGHEMNPRLESTLASRKQMKQRRRSSFDYDF